MGSWDAGAHAELVRLVKQNADSGEIAVFDWDNTSAARDLQAMTSAQLVLEMLLSASSVPPGLSPSFVVDGNEVTLSQEGIRGYSDALAEADISTTGDAWESQAWSGLSLDVAVAQAMKAFDHDSAAQDLRTGEFSVIGDTEVGRQFIYPDMVNLFGYLADNGITPWIVSAGPVWPLRAEIKNSLNPMLAAEWGPDAELPLDHVVGASTLLLDRQTGELVTDANILADASVRDGYLNSDPAVLARYTITPLIKNPYTSDWGKPAAVLQHITRGRPLLVAGDSAGDYGNFVHGRNRLWIARLTSPSLHTGLIDTIEEYDQRTNWIVQPTLNEHQAGYLSSPSDLAERQAKLDPSDQALVEKSISTLESAGLLSGWSNAEGS